jgi:dTDP-4-amino-4,6-dideoxygalactose transaminase
MPLRVPFGDLKRPYDALQHELDDAVQRVLARGWYILGEEGRAFEEEFAAYCGVSHAVGVANGTDALYLALAALGVGAGDEVITVANSCIYQSEAILQTGATPVFVDVCPSTHTMNPEAAAAAITPRTRVLLPVHLYGRLAPMHELIALAERHHLAIVEDAAQAHGAWAYGTNGIARRAGAWGTVGCFSFYPSKNLGALGDGGAVVTNDMALAERLRRLRQYGWGQKYVLAEPGGRNSRLDEVQAALLRVKLRFLDEANTARRERAVWYGEMLADVPSIVCPPDEPGHVYHLYPLVSEQRDTLREGLHRAGIGNDIHYPLPAHMQQGYEGQVRPYGAGMLPHTEQHASQTLSLPMYPELTYEEVERVAEAVRVVAAGSATQS